MPRPNFFNAEYWNSPVISRTGPVALPESLRWSHDVDAVGLPSDVDLDVVGQVLTLSGSSVEAGSPYAQYEAVSSSGDTYDVRYYPLATTWYAIISDESDSLTTDSSGFHDDDVLGGEFDAVPFEIIFDGGNSNGIVNVDVVIAFGIQLGADFVATQSDPLTPAWTNTQTSPLPGWSAIQTNPLTPAWTNTAGATA